MIRKIIDFVLRKLRVLSIFGATALILYLLARGFFFFSADYSWMDRIFGGMLLLGEAYILLHAFGFLLSVIKLTRDNKIDPEEYDSVCSYPPVAVIVAARHEPKKVLRDTFTTINNLDYPNKNIYLLDDSSEEKFLREADELSEEFNIKIFRRKIRHGAKAGIVNDFIRSMS